MNKIAGILLLVIGFLFLHSETGVFKECADHHAGHDVCAIFQNSDNIKTSFQDNSFKSVQEVSAKDLVLSSRALYSYDSQPAFIRLKNFLQSIIFIKNLHLLNALLI